MYGILLIMNLEIRRNCSVELIFAGNFERICAEKNRYYSIRRQLMKYSVTVPPYRYFSFREIATITIYNNINFVSIS